MHSLWGAGTACAVHARTDTISGACAASAAHPLPLVRGVKSGTRVRASSMLSRPPPDVEAVGVPSRLLLLLLALLPLVLAWRCSACPACRH